MGARASDSGRRALANISTTLLCRPGTLINHEGTGDVLALEIRLLVWPAGLWVSSYCGSTGKMVINPVNETARWRKYTGVHVETTKVVVACEVSYSS